jgi:transcriptional regulator with XRE-family HTH domain
MLVVANERSFQNTDDNLGFPNMNNDLGKTIRVLRQAKDLKLGEVAKESGISTPFLSLIESGAREPSLKVLRSISKCLGIPPEALVVMGMGSEKLSNLDKRTTDLTDTVSRLLEIERKLSRLLKKDSSNATRRSNSPASSRSNGAKPR